MQAGDSSGAPAQLVELIERFDPTAFDPGRRQARVRLDGAGAQAWDVVLTGGTARLTRSEPREAPDALLSADAETWKSIAGDLRGGMSAFRSGRLRIRRDLHLGVGLLAATARQAGPQRLRFEHVKTSVGTISLMQAGSGTPVVMLHGLGATKASFLPTVAALAGTHRAIAIDLPGFGDSSKPLTARYDAAFFARSVVSLLDALGVDSAAVIGNSMGGRVALELGLAAPHRVRAIALLAPSLAWLRDRRWAPYLRWLPPQLGLVQPAPRAVVEAIVKRIVPRSDQEWTAAGIDEFLRSYLTARGRAAFYAAARNIYLEEPHGPHGFWTRLPELQTKSLFVWGRRDPLIPIAFSEHVRRALPESEHLVLNCGHVPQLERPKQTHDALLRFLDVARLDAQ